MRCSCITKLTNRKADIMKCERVARRFPPPASPPDPVRGCGCGVPCCSLLSSSIGWQARYRLIERLILDADPSDAEAGLIWPRRSLMTHTWVPRWEVGGVEGGGAAQMCLCTLKRRRLLYLPQRCVWRPPLLQKGNCLFPPLFKNRLPSVNAPSALTGSFGAQQWPESGVISMAASSKEKNL